MGLVHGIQVCQPTYRRQPLVHRQFIAHNPIAYNGKSIYNLFRDGEPSLRVFRCLCDSSEHSSDAHGLWRRVFRDIVSTRRFLYIQTIALDAHGITANSLNHVDIPAHVQFLFGFSQQDQMPITDSF